MCVECGCGLSDRGSFHGPGESRGELHSHKNQGPHGHAGERRVFLERDILAKNGRLAEENRKGFREKGILALNLLSSPGSGKTTLIEKTIGVLGKSLPMGVIEGDQATSRDADRIRRTGVPAVQVNTGKGCHLDAHQVAHASGDLSLASGSVLVIENIGNLVCPALFDLGESARVVLFSVTEGEDKPLKYPQMFQKADLVLLTKTDLLPHLEFDREAAENFIRAMNPGAGILGLSAKTGEGMGEWISWIASRRESVHDFPSGGSS